jgi:hypothetical protein
MATVTPKQKAAFLNTLTKTGNVSKAAQTAKHPRSTWYKLRDENEGFAELWEDALNEGLDELEEKLFERGKTGQSDTAAIFLLKAHRPGMYRDHGVIEHKGGITVKNEWHLHPVTTKQEIEQG